MVEANTHMLDTNQFSHVAYMLREGIDRRIVLADEDPDPVDT